MSQSVRKRKILAGVKLVEGEEEKDVDEEATKKVSDKKTKKQKGKKNGEEDGVEDGVEDGEAIKKWNKPIKKQMEIEEKEKNEEEDGEKDREEEASRGQKKQKVGKQDIKPDKEGDVASQHQQMLLHKTKQTMNNRLWYERCTFIYIHILSPVLGNIGSLDRLADVV